MFDLCTLKMAAVATALSFASNAADENRRRHRVERNADALALQIFRFLNLVLVDADEGVTEAPRGENRDGDEVAFLVGVALHVFRAGISAVAARCGGN